MPLMTRLRDNMPVILIGLVVAFVLMIVFEWGMDYLGIATRGHDRVGKIEDRVVTLNEFSELVRRASEDEKAQMNTEIDETNLARIRDQVWNSIVTQTLLRKELERMGIIVTDQEILDWVHSDNPPDFLRQQFVDTLGVFNREAYLSAMRDLRKREIWISIEGILREQLLQQKLQSVLFASVRATEAEVLRRFADQNVQVEVEYVLIDPVRLIKDEDVQVTDADIRKFYNDHSDEFKIEETRRLKYVMFREVPSEQDTAATLAEANDVLRRVKLGAEFLDIAGDYGDLRQPDAYFKPGELGHARDAVVFGARAGEIVGPVLDSEGFHLIKILEDRKGTDEFVRASHILIPVENDDSAAALQKAQDLLRQARAGADFAELAKAHSTDKVSAARGGDLGWFGKGRMVKPFEDAAFAAPIGRVVGPVRTQFGYHLIRVSEKTRREVKIADLVVPIRISSTTRNQISDRALDFAYLAKENGFEREAEQLGFTVLETPAFTKGSPIPGIGLNETVSSFAFGGRVGAISDVVTLQNGYAVFKISEVTRAGVRPLEEVKETIRPRVLREKKFERARAIAEEIYKKASTTADLRSAIADRTELRVEEPAAFSLSGFVPGVGNDPAFIGAVAATDAGNITRPFRGIRGYYLVAVKSKSDLDMAAFEAQRASLRSQITQEKRNRFVNDWVEYLKANADIEDNRALFFR